MGIQVSAFSKRKTATIAINTQESGAIMFQDFAQGMFIIPAAFDGSTVSFLVAPTEDGTYVPVHDSSDTLVTITVDPSHAYAFPIALFAAPFIKIKSASSETAARAIEVMLKY